MPTVRDMAVAIIAREGGLNNVDGDRGGITNHGVSLRYARGKGLMMDLNHDGVVDEKDIMLVTPDKAIELFVEDFFERPGFGKLPLVIHPAMFDMAVNFGAGGAGMVLQAALNTLGFGPLRVDGEAGPQTQTAAAKAAATSASTLVNGLVEARILRFRRIASADPGQRKFLAGWIARANEFRA
jgi:lysozyme family protein